MKMNGMVSLLCKVHIINDVLCFCLHLVRTKCIFTVQAPVFSRNELIACTYVLRINHLFVWFLFSIQSTLADTYRTNLYFGCANFVICSMLQTVLKLE